MTQKSLSLIEMELIVYVLWAGPDALLKAL